MERKNVTRAADLFWLAAHQTSGVTRLSNQSYALGLAASVLAELLTQPALTAVPATDPRWRGALDLAADPVCGPVMADILNMASEDIARPARTWIEWLARNRHDHMESAVLERLERHDPEGHNVIVYRRGHPAPADHWAAEIPFSVLTATLNGLLPETDTVRALAGLCMSLGLANELIEQSGREVDLNLLFSRAAPSLVALRAGLDDSLYALVVRRN